mgnify:FL=1
MLSLMKHKKERMYMAYMIQQHPQQISTESLAHQKRKSVADKSSRCEASSFFFPLFVFRSTDSTKSTVESVSDITTIIPNSVTEAAIMYGGVASGTKIRIIRICGAKSAATPPHQKQKRRMITKVRYSKNPGKTIDYILNPKKGAHVVIARGVSSLTDIGILTEDFNRQCALRPSLKVKAVHIPISFHVNDTTMLEVHAEEIIGDWIRHMERHGYRFDQFLVGRHHDKDNKNPHFHFLANVVLDDGTRANLANIGKAAKEASISVTEQWGLTPANHRKRMQTGDKKDTNKNESRTAEIHNHRHQNYIEWDSNPASNEDTNSDFTASNDRESSTSSISGNLMEGITELIIQPTVARIGTGSGNSDNTLDHDKNKQRKGGRRR